MDPQTADQPRKHERTNPRCFSCFRVFVALLVVFATATAGAQQSFSGRLSDSLCGASHQPKASSDTDRQCLLACIKALGKYVLVGRDGKMMPIANQDAMGLPLYAGRPVKITGELKGNAIVVAKVEAIAAHLHVGHVMTNWRDTPGARGFLPVAVEEARVAAQHAGLAAKGTALDDIHLHAARVLHALDPAVEPKGPGAGYGVRKAIDGALQHLNLAATAEGATAAVTSHAAKTTTLLSGAMPLVDQAIAAAQKARSATNAVEAARFAADVEALTTHISDEKLRQALAEMNLMLKAEGLAGAPR